VGDRPGGDASSLERQGDHCCVWPQVVSRDGRMNITRGKFLKLGLMGDAGLVLPLATLSVPISRMSAFAGFGALA
jgi:hypothetical protein